MSTAAPVKQTRKAYTRVDYGYLLQHYSTKQAASCAANMGRTVGSLKGFISRHPELMKRPRA